MSSNSPNPPTLNTPEPAELENAPSAETTVTGCTEYWDEINREIELAIRWRVPIGPTQGYNENPGNYEVRADDYNFRQRRIAISELPLLFCH